MPLSSVRFAEANWSRRLQYCNMVRVAHEMRAQMMRMLKWNPTRYDILHRRYKIKLKAERRTFILYTKYDSASDLWDVVKWGGVTVVVQNWEDLDGEEANGNIHWNNEVNGHGYRCTMALSSPITQSNRKNGTNVGVRRVSIDSIARPL